MSPRSLFIILIKLFGLGVILHSLEFFYSLISSFSYALSYSQQSGESIAYLILGILGYALIFGTVINYCLFKPQWIVDKLNLDKGFTEEKFELNIHSSTILRISTIVVGMLILAEAIPGLFQNGFELIKDRQNFDESRQSFENPYSTKWLLFSFVKTLIGLLMVAYNRRIVSFIERKRREDYSD